MTQASIGHHCPECVAGQSQQVYRARDLVNRRPPVITALMAVNVVAFLAQIATQERITVEGILWGPAVADGQWWRLVTSAFLHGNLMHIGFNMYALWIFGRPLEDAFGPVRFGLTYLAGLLGGSLAVLAFNFGAPTLGASGAVLGLAGALAAVLWARGINITQTSLGFIFLINLGLPLLVPRISFWGHFGGIAAGFAAGWLLSWLPSRFGWSSGAARSATIGLSVALAVASVAVAGMGGVL